MSYKIMKGLYLLAVPAVLFGLVLLGAGFRSWRNMNRKDHDDNDQA